MTGNRVPLATIKAAVCPGRIFDVTNHLITRPDHPLSGTTRRTVTRTTRQRFYLSHPHPDRDEGEVTWPKAAQVQMDGDGTIRLYGGGLGQDPDDLFLTLVPVTNGIPARCPAYAAWWAGGVTNAVSAGLWAASRRPQQTTLFSEYDLLADAP